MQHTLLMHHTGYASLAMIHRRLLYKVKASFSPPSLVSDTVMMLIARPDRPADDLIMLTAVFRERGVVEPRLFRRPLTHDNPSLSLVIYLAGSVVVSGG